jgi:hypothetical protein
LGFGVLRTLLIYATKPFGTFDAVTGGVHSISSIMFAWLLGILVIQRYHWPNYSIGDYSTTL